MSEHKISEGVYVRFTSRRVSMTEEIDIRAFVNWKIRILKDGRSLYSYEKKGHQGFLLVDRDKDGNIVGVEIVGAKSIEPRA